MDEVLGKQEPVRWTSVKCLRYCEQDRSRRSKGIVLDEEYNVSRHGGKSRNVLRGWSGAVVPAEVREGASERREGEARSFGESVFWEDLERLRKEHRGREADLLMKSVTGPTTRNISGTPFQILNTMSAKYFARRQPEIFQFQRSTQILSNECMQCDVSTTRLHGCFISPVIN